MCEISVIPLGDLLAEPPGYGANSPALPAVKGWPRYIRITDISESGELIDSDIKGIDLRIASPYLLKEGDILIARSGNTVGKSYLHRDSKILSAHAGYLIKFRFDEEKANPIFIFHYLHSGQYWSWVQSASKIAAQPNINAKQYSQLPIPNISVTEQHAIATILDSMDEAIRRTEAVLAKMRQVKAGILHDLLTRGLDENGELRDPLRHPEQFKDSPMGRIPKEWLLQQMSDVLMKKPSNGYSPKETVTFTGFFVLGLSCLTADGFKGIQLKPIDPADVHPENVLQDGDLLLSRANTLQLVALPGIFKDVGYICTYPDLMMRLIPKPYLLPEFLELVLRYSRLRNHLVCNANGTSASMMKINATTVMNSPVIYPHLPEQERILKAIESSNEMLAKAQLESDKLKSIKQGLQQDLLTGHVRIPPHLLEAMS